MKTLAETLYDYLALRTGLGFEFLRHKAQLPDFVSFIEDAGGVITRELAVAWATRPSEASAGYWAQRLGLVRGFAKFRRLSDPRTEIPPADLLPFGHRRARPYIYTEDELARLFAAARALPPSVADVPKLRASTYVTLLGLLTVTGLRISEALALTDGDVDVEDYLLTIRESKFRKSRLVPVHSTTISALQSYTRLRDRLYPRRNGASLFIDECGNRLGYYGVRKTFARLRHETGLVEPDERRGPRLHDLRHRFAVATLRRWYQEGADVEARITQLATYLGHRKVSDTYWYLSADPELLHHALARVDDSD